MLLSFSVNNFRSFQADQTLNLFASKRLGEATDADCFEVPGTAEHVLRVIALYGANGAGKSNLVKALALLKQLIRGGTQPGQSLLYKPFLFDKESPTRPTLFELQFLADGKVYGYGVCFDIDRIHEEWLDVYDGKKERNIFSRVTAQDGVVTVDLGKGIRHPPKIEALAQVGARPNQPFISEVVNLDDPKAQGDHFQSVIGWFSGTLTVIEPDAAFVSLAEEIATDAAFAEFAGRFLCEASTGVASLDVRIENASKYLTDAFENIAATLPTGRNLVLPGPSGGEVFQEGTGKGRVKVRRIWALHNTSEEEKAQLPLGEESDGSQRLLNLLPALHDLTRQGGVFVIDELERSMHPMLARKFIEFFRKVGQGAKSQLIFTTHESTLLDLDLLRRDGIWFAEKDIKGSTHLYSLADFKVRKDLRIEKGYLEGRFGAIPFLGGIDHLMEEQTAAESEA